jgi:hypothetical protein
MVDVYVGDKPVLLAEDNQNDVSLITRALKEAGIKRHIQAVYSGAARYLN